MINQSANTKAKEHHRVDSIAHIYTSMQIDFDKKLNYMGYLTIKPYFTGQYGLELGCGSGKMTRYLLADFAELTVVDGSSELLAGLPPAPNLKKMHSLFENFTPEKKFDTIIMGHILEHIESPVELLAKAKDWLAPSGRIVAIVPNALSFDRLVAVKMKRLQHSSQLNERDLTLGHRRVYRPEDFAADFCGAGLEVITQGGMFFKPLSNQQIQEQWDEQMIQAFFELGKDFPENGAEIYLVAANPK